MAMVDRHIKDNLRQAGWQPGTALEDRITWMIHRAGFRHDELVGRKRNSESDPYTVIQQHRLGRYTLDFAWPKVKVALEADGWHHRSPEGAAKDAERDSWLRSQGWLIFRVDDRNGWDVLLDQTARALRTIHLIAEAAR